MDASSALDTAEEGRLKVRSIDAGALVESARYEVRGTLVDFGTIAHVTPKQDLWLRVSVKG